MASHPGDHRAKDASEERIATPDEVRQAIESLTEEDTAKLKAASRVLAFSIRLYVWGRDEDDLLKDAVFSILQGNRKWRPNNVDLVGLLVGAMRSIADNLKRKGKRQKPPILDSDLIKVDEQGEELSTPVESAADPRPNAEAVLLQGEAMTEERLDAGIEVMFRDDVVASLVLEGRRIGMKGPEIMAKLDISRKEFDAAVKKIRRRITARWLKGRSYEQ